MAEINNLDKVTGVFQIGRTQVVKKELIIKKIYEKGAAIEKARTLREQIPKGATHNHGGYFYKKGAHGYTYIYDVTLKSWERTEKSLSNGMRL